MLCLGMNCISKDSCPLSVSLKAAFQLNSDQVQRDLTFAQQSSQSLWRRSRELIGLSISGSCDPGSVWTHEWVVRLSPEAHQPFSKLPESPGRGQSCCPVSEKTLSRAHASITWLVITMGGNQENLTFWSQETGIDRPLLSKLKCWQVHVHSNIIFFHSVLTGSIFLT